MTPYEPSTQYERLIVAATRMMSERSPVIPVAEVADAAGVAVEAAQTLFPDDAALCSVVIEQAMLRLVDHITAHTVAADRDDPVAQLRGLVQGYFDWAANNPEGCRVLLNPALLDRVRDHQLARYNEAILTLAQGMLARAAAAGRMRSGVDVGLWVLTVRALMLGLVGLQAMDQFSDWYAGSDPAAAVAAAIDRQFDLLFLPPPAPEG